MIKDSIILSAICTFFIKMWDYYKNSGYYKMINIIVDYFSLKYKNSFLYYFFTRNSKREFYSIFAIWGEVTFRFINRVLGVPIRYFKSILNESMIVKVIDFMYENWYKISLRYYALSLFAFICVKTATDMIIYGSVNYIIIIFGILGLTGFAINTSFVGLYEGSEIRKLLRLPAISDNSIVNIKGYIGLTASLISGAFVGALSILPMWYLFIAGLLGLILLIKIPRLGVILTVILFPFLPTMAVAGLIIISTIVIIIECLSGDNGSIKIDGFDMAIWGMCLLLAYGVLNSFAPKSSIPIAAIYFIFVSFFLILRRQINNENIFYKLIDLMIVAGTIVALYGLYQKVAGLDSAVWQDSQMFEDISGRVYSTLENPNVLGEYLLLIIPITLGRIWYTTSKNQKIALTLAIVLQIICMVYTFSRGCWIGLIVALALFIAFNGKKIIGVGLASIFLLPYVLPNAIIQRLGSIGNMSDSSTSYRVYIWQGTIHMLKDFWLFGVGIGEVAFNKVYPIYALNAITAPHPHNLYLHILSMFGIIGLIIFLFVIINFFKSVSFAKVSNKKNFILSVSLGTGMIGFLIQGMFDNVWYNYRIFFFFFLILGLATILRDISKGEVKRL